MDVILDVGHPLAVLSGRPSRRDLAVRLDEDRGDAEAAALVIFGDELVELRRGLGEGHVVDDSDVVAAQNVDDIFAQIVKLCVIAAARSGIAGLDEEQAMLLGRCMGDGECEWAECCHDFHSSIWFDLFSDRLKSRGRSSAGQRSDGGSNERMGCLALAAVDAAKCDVVILCDVFSAPAAMPVASGATIIGLEIDGGEADLAGIGKIGLDTRHQIFCGIEVDRPDICEIALVESPYSVRSCV